MKVIPEMCTAH